MSAKEQNQLIDDFIACFRKFDEMSAYKESDPIAWQLKSGEADEYGRYPWTPLKSISENSLLEPLYGKLPGRFPTLYERLILTYRWAQVEVGRFCLLANPPGVDLSGVMTQMLLDKPMRLTLSQAGYIQFGRGPGGNYDPVCFDLKSRRKQNRECKVVKLDHEEILCNNRIKVIEELAQSFEELVRDTIDRARQL